MDNQGKKETGILAAINCHRMPSSKIYPNLAVLPVSNNSTGTMVNKANHHVGGHKLFKVLRKLPRTKFFVFISLLMAEFLMMCHIFGKPKSQRTAKLLSSLMQRSTVTYECFKIANWKDGTETPWDSLFMEMRFTSDNILCMLRLAHTALGQALGIQNTNGNKIHLLVI